MHHIIKRGLLSALLFIPAFCFSQNSDDFKRGFELFQKQDYKGALDYFSKEIAANPNNSEAYNFIGIVNGELGNLQVSLAAFDKALAIDPKSYKVYSNRAHV